MCNQRMWTAILAAVVFATAVGAEETGKTLDGKFIALSAVKLKSGKIIYSWALQGDVDHKAILSNTFEIEWPPKSGKKQTFPEVDRADWFTVEEAAIKLNSAQVPIVKELQALLSR